ncbi:MAG: hypothetical protein IPH40_04705 [Polaromonas sp.]|nr:hypothetical protein [Polaromonas sp.]
MWPITYSGDPAAFAARVVKAMYKRRCQSGWSARTHISYVGRAVVPRPRYHSRIIADVNKCHQQRDGNSRCFELEAKKAMTTLLSKVSQTLKGSFTKSSDVVKHWGNSSFGNYKNHR